MMLKLMLGYLAKLWIKQERVVWVVWRLRSISWLAVLFVLFVALSVYLVLGCSCNLCYLAIGKLLIEKKKSYAGII